jgi:regulator of sigma E protease
MLISFIAFIVTIGILVTVHEWGHFRMAKACGVRVLRFAIGFGPVIWSYRRTPEDTEYALCLLPLGGYVQMQNEQTPTPIHITSATGAAARWVSSDSYHTKPLWQRSLIVAAGPCINLILAIVLLSFCYWIGVAEPIARIGTPAASTAAAKAGLQAGDLIEEICWAEDTCYSIQTLPELHLKLTEAALASDTSILRVSSHHNPSYRQVTLALTRPNEESLDPQFLQQLGLSQLYYPAIMGTITPQGPADIAGLQEGDTIIRINSIPIHDGVQARRLIANAEINLQTPKAMEWEIHRNGQVLHVTIRPRLDGQGKTALPRIDAVIGAPAEAVVLELPLWQASIRGFERTYDLSLLTLRMIGKMVIGQASLKNISGPISIADFAGRSAQRGLTYYLMFLAMVSLSLGILNLLPIPMLDGGQLLYHLYEWVRGQPISTVWNKRLQILGLIALGSLMTLGITNDILRLFSIP